ncbi:MAG: NAD-dependent epimerase/dehydratase family protein [Puniceicoccales bacterium]|jgi:nucleoside-diphosphate-sugar epimerase|nr:NAD-dependent epimerase/dehydratase family protein [Puniceicoccales bacterium]
MNRPVPNGKKPSEKPRVLLTGGTGFLGSYFIREGLSAGLSIRALRRQGATTCIPLQAQPDWVEGNLEDFPDQGFTECDVLVHLAACGVSPQKATMQEMLMTNVVQSSALWQRAREAGAKRFVICGSCFEYGASASCYDAIPPNAPLCPVEPYGASKAAASMAALAFAATTQCELLLARPFHFFGEGQFAGNLWPSLKKAALGGEDFSMTSGGQIRDFLPVEDVARHFVTGCLRTDIKPGVAIIENIGSGRPESLADFARRWWTYWRASGKLNIGALPYRENEIMRFVPAI